MLVLNNEYMANNQRQQALQEHDFYAGLLIYTAIFTLLIFRSFMIFIKKHTDLK